MKWSWWQRWLSGFFYLFDDFAHFRNGPAVAQVDSVWRDSCICMIWLVHMCDVTRSCVWRDAFICVTWCIHMCDVTDSYVWRDAIIRVTRLIHTCDVTQLYVWRNAFIYVTWLTHMCDVTHSYVWRDCGYVSRTWFRRSHMVVQTLLYCTRKCGCEGGVVSASCRLQPHQKGSTGQVPALDHENFLGPS